MDNLVGPRPKRGRETFYSTKPTLKVKRRILYWLLTFWFLHICEVSIQWHCKFLESQKPNGEFGFLFHVSTTSSSDTWDPLTSIRQCLYFFNRSSVTHRVCPPQQDFFFFSSSEHHFSVSFPCGRFFSYAGSQLIITWKVSTLENLCFIAKISKKDEMTLHRFRLWPSINQSMFRHVIWHR